MDLELLRDIISRGAGASAMFDAAVKPMLKSGTLSLKAFQDTALIREQLKIGLQKAAEIDQPLPMAAAALQQLYVDNL